MSKPQRHVFICTQTRPQGHPRGCCNHKGSVDVLQAFWKELQARNIYDTVAVTYSGCIGPCDAGPNVLVYPEGVMYSGVTVGDVAEIFTEHLQGDKPVERLLADAQAWS
ncbi:(2Fe-2S) ferredoxin domain-containing protein [Ampullimonas aquatilis]|uniref:(2Fe-2S) ferredoxin domain-containing protein n=1 Tax=Ampullimonas aquatilis TaxID=1341549 RepID=UPI003C739347